MTNPFTHASEDFLKLNPDLRGEVATKLASKYHNARTEAAGMQFASGKEAGGVANLIMLEEQKLIFALRLQVRFPLAGGIVYVADAVFCQLVDGILSTRVVDFKGFPTKEYKLKRKLFREKYCQDIEEC
jgi:hypothetical protein